MFSIGSEGSMVGQLIETLSTSSSRTPKTDTPVVFAASRPAKGVRSNSPSEPALPKVSSSGDSDQGVMMASLATWRKGPALGSSEDDPTPLGRAFHTSSIEVRDIVCRKWGFGFGPSMVTMIAFRTHDP